MYELILQHLKYMKFIQHDDPYSFCSDLKYIL